MFNKKMILMLVLLTVVVSSAAIAADYKVYGKLHTTIDMMNDSEDSQVKLASNTSRFGFKGSQEMNENFSFIWQFEQKLNLAQTGNEVLSNRNTFIGVTGDWGTFLGGIHDTPFKTLGRKTTFFFDELGDFRTATMGWDKRLTDVLVYASPNFDGFNFTAAYKLDTGKIGAMEAETAFSANAMYNKDGLLLGAAVEMLSKGYSPFSSSVDSEVAVGHFDDDNDPETPDVIVYETVSTSSVVAYGDAVVGLRFGGKYTTDKFGVSALFQTLSNANQTWVNDAVVAGGTASTVGGEVKYQFDPKFAFKAAYYLANPNADAKDIASTGDLDESDVSYSQLAVGIDHTYAKNLGFYAQYVMMMNGDAANATLGGGAHGAAVTSTGLGNNASGISVGSWFTF